MLEAFAESLQVTGFSQTLRSSVWLYPLVNTGHVLGIALLFGAIVPLDLRLLGWFRDVALEGLARVLVPIAFTGLLLAIGTGVLLFATRPSDYVVEPLFGVKIALLVAAIANAALLRKLPVWALLRVKINDDESIPARWKLAGLLIILWLAVITVGRLIGYR